MVHLVKQDECARGGRCWVVEKRTMGSATGGRLSNGCSVSCITGVEFNHVPSHVFSNRSSNGRFSYAGWPNEQQGFFLR